MMVFQLWKVLKKVNRIAKLNRKGQAVQLGAGALAGGGAEAIFVF